MDRRCRVSPLTRLVGGAAGGWLLLFRHMGGADAFLPGVGPSRFRTDQEIPLFVNELSSTKTQMPLDYYSMPFCQEKHRKERESLGEYLEGDRIETSPYHIYVNQNMACAVACAKTLTQSERYLLASTIKDEYQVHLTVDNLPAAKPVVAKTRVVGNIGAVAPDEEEDSSIFYVRGFPVGFMSQDGQQFLNNHLHITLAIHPLSEGATEYNLVGFMVEEYSVNHKYSGEYLDGIAIETCGPNGYQANDPYQLLSVFYEGEVLFTYDVVWDEVNMPWTQRWDIYLNSSQGQDSKIHWFSIMNSCVIVLFLTMLVAMILIRALRKDIQRYNAETVEDAKEESGWKLVHGDVLRPPLSYPVLFAVCVGTGVQLLCTMFLVIFFSTLGLVSPARRGNMVTVAILLFVLMGGFSGYNAARLHRRFRGTSWLKTTIATATLFPALCFFVFFILNTALFLKKSTGAVPFGPLCVLLFLWLMVQTPLVFIGSYLGFQKDSPEQVVSTNQIPRMIPQTPWYIDPKVAVPFAGVLPFGSVFVELYFVMSALWQERLYFIFQFLMLVMVILAVTCTEIAIVMCYFQLCAEDYRWWWRSMLWPGSCAGWMFLYSVWYYIHDLDMVGFVPALLFFGYTGILAVSFFLVTGAIGYFSCQWFINKIYSSIKVD